uniref:Uncharacterized protein n=1 Tax=Erpetoichthys calabaricus TaxID=27687 RepID=A0A8C4RGF1_ERPCA
MQPTIPMSSNFLGKFRSCTFPEFPCILFNSTLVLQDNADSQFDMTFLMFILIGSYRFCIIPLLAAFNGKDIVLSLSGKI